MKNLVIKSTIQIRINEGEKNLPISTQVARSLKKKSFEEKYGFHLVEVYRVKEENLAENTDVLFSTQAPTEYQLTLVCECPPEDGTPTPVNPNAVGDGLMVWIGLILPEYTQMHLLFQHDKIPVGPFKADSIKDTMDPDHKMIRRPYQREATLHRLISKDLRSI